MSNSMFFQNPVHGTAQLIEFPDNKRFCVITTGVIQPGDFVFDWMDNCWVEVKTLTILENLFGFSLKAQKVAGRIVVREF